MRLLLATLLLVATSALQAGDPPPMMTIIIDDMGDRLPEGRRVAALEGPVVCAMLPHTGHVRALADACDDAGKEVMLHLPMQAMNGAPMGPGGVKLDMDRDSFRARVKESLASVPHAIAVNNHMGSLLTQHPGHMTWLMELLAEQDGMIFVDSRTTARTVAQRMAQEQDVPNVRRDVFLDHDRDEDAITEQFFRLVALARERGAAVGIGHPYPETLAVLERELPGLQRNYGVELVPLSRLHAHQTATGGFRTRADAGSE
ncbi:MAG: divergent polysaccharide deacetylase family protein [Ectothiorhodospiraceae bacterium]|nr:divergent polysaccharide deacetylase family protein [Ectothiorhodospiraceae bacterium]MCH8504097.1 divergent polysaccharide deacetylase family protein [Ectothiorhodospiraceae bacterium]